MKHNVALSARSTLQQQTLPGGGVRLTLQGWSSPASLRTTLSLFIVVIGLYGCVSTKLEGGTVHDTARHPLYSIPWRYVGPIYLILLFGAIRIRHDQVFESITINPALGVQLTTSRNSRSMFVLRSACKDSTTFIPKHKILDLYIGEGFNRFSIQDYLALSVIVDGEPNGAPGAKIQRVFPNMQPRLPVLIEAYNVLHHHLFPEHSTDITAREVGA